MAPLIGITCDLGRDEAAPQSPGRFIVNRAYADAVVEAGGIPLLLPCIPELAADYGRLCDGFILTGGDDPIMEHWGIATHPKARRIAPERQAFELALLGVLDQRPQTPVLGVCLGMQLMGLHAGGALDQHLPDSLPSASQHWGKVPHKIAGEIGRGTVLSHHRQALTDPGSMRVVAKAPDGVIEAIAAHEQARSYYLGVQWHPERTDDPTLGRGLIKRLVEAARSSEPQNARRYPR